MDFLEHLVRKSEIENKNTEYFNYRPPLKRPRTRRNAEKPAELQYESLNDSPLVSSYVVFDFETTGLSAGINAIMEIGAIRVKNDVIDGKFSMLVNPRQYIPGYISSRIHITNTMVADKPDITVILPQFIDFIGDLPLIAHNAGFDMSFLLRACKDNGITINNKVIDTLYLSKHYLKECKKHNLGYLTEYFDIALTNAHRAYYDAEATQKLYEIIKQHIKALN